MVEFDDWRRAPNIADHPDLYERENEAIDRDGRLWSAIHATVDHRGRDVLDLGCGTGFWLQHWPHARSVLGIEPDPALRGIAAARTDDPQITLRAGSAEHLPCDDDSVDLVFAQFAYFFGPGADAGFHEAGRVLRSGGALLVVDNEPSSGDFGALLAASDVGNAALDHRATAAWWAERGATRSTVDAGWQARDAAELEAILRIEFPAAVVDQWVTTHPERASLSYTYALYRCRFES